MTADTQALCLMTDILLEQTKLEEWQRLSPPVQAAEIALRASAAKQLQQVAAYVETGHCPKSAELEYCFRRMEPDRSAAGGKRPPAPDSPRD